MYKQFLSKRSSKINYGLFSSITIPANSLITEFTGRILSLKDLPVDSSMYLQIGPDLFLAPTGTIDGADFINHSCNPNCYIHAVGHRAFLYSLYIIQPNMELTFDYSTTSTDTLDMWKMDCKCNSPKCRKVISGHQYLDEQTKQDYTNKKIFPLFITNPNLFSKTW